MILAATSQPPPAWLLPLLPPAFVVLWLLLFRLVAALGGWQELASGYRTHRLAEGTSWRFASATLGRGTNYGGCLTFTANREGFFIRPMLPFRFAHAPVFVPWSDVTVEWQKRRWLPDSARLVLQRVPGTPITISRRLAERMKEAVGDAWPQARER